MTSALLELELPSFLPEMQPHLVTMLDMISNRDLEPRKSCFRAYPYPGRYEGSF